MKTANKANKVLWIGLAVLISALPLFITGRMIAATQGPRFTLSTEVTIVGYLMLTAIFAGSGLLIIGAIMKAR